ncbi:hypothetical protein ADUPG1_001687, partial [Aduncisulcus paluster]
MNKSEGSDSYQAPSYSYSPSGSQPSYGSASTSSLSDPSTRSLTHLRESTSSQLTLQKQQDIPRFAAALIPSVEDTTSTEQSRSSLQMPPETNSPLNEGSHSFGDIYREASPPTNVGNRSMSYDDTHL